MMLSDRDPVCSFPTVLAEMLDLSSILVAIFRPHRLNVMTMETISDVRESFDRPEGDRYVRAVILTGRDVGCAPVSIRSHRVTGRRELKVWSRSRGPCRPSNTSSRSIGESIDSASR